MTPAASEAAPAGAQQRGQVRGKLELLATTLTTFASVTEVAEDWASLHRRAPTGSAFDHPGWALAWAREFVADGDLCCVAVRDARDGTLVGLAPLYRRRHGRKGLGAVSLQPLGTGPGEALSEVTQIVCAHEMAGKVIPLVLAHLDELSGWNWLQLILGPEQGWFVPQWLKDPGSFSILHRAVRPAVVYRPLPTSRGQLLAELKRNVRESVRRGVNRTNALENFALRVTTEPADTAAALRSVVALHQRRASMEDKVKHRDAMGDPRQQQFLTTAVASLQSRGLARVHVASIDGVDVAGLVVLSDGTSDYLSLTGVDPQVWELNLGALLVFEAMVHAAEHGRSALNLSTGPDVAKLRWSADIVAYNEFGVVRGDRRSQLLYAAYAHVSLARRHRQERKLHRRG